MSYYYLLDRFDELGFNDLSSTLTPQKIEKWLDNQDLLCTLRSMMDTISTKRNITNPIRPPQANKTPHIPPNTFKKLVAGWLVDAQCPYLDLFTPSTPPLSPPSPPTTPKQPNQFAYFDLEDTIGLVVEFITAEYQAIIFAQQIARVDKKAPNGKSASTSSAANSASAAQSDSQLSHEDLKWKAVIDKLDINDKAKIDSLLTLRPTTFPSLSQYLHHLLHTSSLQLLDIEMYTTVIDQENDKIKQLPPDTTAKKSSKSAAQANFSRFSATALSSIIPQTYTPQLLAEFDTKLTSSLNYYQAQLTLAKSSKTATPLTPIFSTLSTKLFSTDKQNQLFNSIQKSIKTLTPAELKIISQQLNGLYRDYKTRHRMILTKMLTQTQTFLLTLKLQYLQLQRDSTKSHGNIAQKVNKGAKAAAIGEDTEDGKKIQKPKSTKPVKGVKGNTKGKKPIEDGADEQFDSDHDNDDEQAAVGNNVTNIEQLEVNNDDYDRMVKNILVKYRQTARLAAHLQPVSLPDLFTLAPYIALVLQHGNEKQLHRPRSKFQLHNHPKTKTLQAMQDRGGRL